MDLIEVLFRQKPENSLYISKEFGVYEDWIVSHKF